MQCVQTRERQDFIGEGPDPVHVLARFRRPSTGRTGGSLADLRDHQISELQGVTTLMRSALQEAIGSAVELKEELQRVRLVGVRRAREVQALRAELRTVQDRIEATTARLDAETAALTARDEAVAALRNRLTTRDEEAAVLQIRASESHEAIAALRREIASKDATNARYELRNAELETRVGMLSREMAVLALRPRLKRALRAIGRVVFQGRRRSPVANRS